MKICHVINSLNRGGAESHLLELAKAQNNEGLLIDIVVIGKDNKNIFFNCDKEQLSRVFFNLIKNSIESIHQKSEKVSNFNKNISIELNETDDHISLVIDDTGIGFKNLDTNIKNILNPYFTTKQKGTGLGLSIVNKIINDHNGNIEFLSKNDGAKIKIIFIK